MPLSYYHRVSVCVCVSFGWVKPDILGESQKHQVLCNEGRLAERLRFENYSFLVTHQLICHFLAEQSMKFHSVVLFMKLFVDGWCPSPYLNIFKQQAPK